MEVARVVGLISITDDACLCLWRIKNQHSGSV